MRVRRPSGRRPFNLLVTPLLSGREDSTLRNAVTTLFISDPGRSFGHQDAAIRTLFGLTEAEAELVLLLCDGLSLEEAALRRGVKMNTARTQLKYVFAKTKTGRQSELVRLILLGVPPA